MNLANAREIVETMAREFPNAYRIAKVVSIAVRIEPELLRKARLSLLPPEVDAGAEADLWFSPLVQSQTPLAMTFLPEVTEVLREHLGKDERLLKASWELVNEFHENAPPALRLEEELIWLALSGQDNSEAIKKRFESVIVAMAQENRPGLAQWAIRALPALPPKARDSETARILSIVASAPEPVVNLTLPGSTGSAGVNQWLSQIISKSLPKAAVGVRLITEEVKATAAGSGPDSSTNSGMPESRLLVEFSYPPATGLKPEEVIHAPQTNPVLIEVTWAKGKESYVERVSLQPDTTRRMDVGSSELTIRTALGDVHQIGPRFDYDFFLYFNPGIIPLAKLFERLRQQQETEPTLRLAFHAHDQEFEAINETENERAFRLSRKVGFVMSPESVWQDWEEIEHWALKRPDSSRPSQWLIPISFGPIERPHELSPLVTLDFGPKSDFERSYEQLLSAITGEPAPAPAPIESKEAPTHLEAGIDTESTVPATEPAKVFAFIPSLPATGLLKRLNEDGEDLVEWLTKELQQPKLPKIALNGPGGVGKTTLAAATARQLSIGFEGRIVWLNMDARSDFTLSTMLDEIAVQMGHKNLRAAAPDQKEVAVADLTKTRVVIFVDNFDFVTSEERARCLKFLTSQAKCSVLITTRQRISDFRNIAVNPLSQQQTSEYLTLLIRHATGVAPVIDPDSIIRSANGSPIVIRWLVMQTAVSDGRSLTSELPRLSEPAPIVFEKLIGPPYLDEDALTTLLALSLFSGGASLDSLNAIIFVGDNIYSETLGDESDDVSLPPDLKRLNRALRRLSDLTLVEPADASNRVTIEGLTRELAKVHFARYLLGNNLKARFTKYFLSAATPTPGRSRPSPNFEIEKDNLMSAMSLALERKDWDAAIRLFNTPFTDFLIAEGMLEDALSWCDRALKAAQDSHDQAAEGAISIKVAAVCAQRQEYSKSGRIADRALSIFRELRLETQLIGALEQSALVQQQQGNLSKAEKLLSESLAVNRRTENPVGTARALEKLGSLMEAKGQLREAESFYRQSQTAYVIIADKQGQATSAYHLGRLARLSGKKEEAIKLLRLSATFFNSLESPDANLPLALLDEIEKEPLKQPTQKTSPVSRSSVRRSSLRSRRISAEKSKATKLRDTSKRKSAKAAPKSATAVPSKKTTASKTTGRNSAPAPATKKAVTSKKTARKGFTPGESLRTPPKRRIAKGPVPKHSLATKRSKSSSKSGPRKQARRFSPKKR